MSRRLTIIARDVRKPDMDWSGAPDAGEVVAFIDSTTALRTALMAGVELGLDIGRIIVDRAGTPDQFLELLATLPVEFTGDALFIRDDGTGVMSAAGRGDGRVVYSLQSVDVRFYLETCDLVTGRIVVHKRTA